ncbi:MAG: copper chaperone PCu(A)C [Gammaproteobacteria bacterium]
MSARHTLTGVWIRLVAMLLGLAAIVGCSPADDQLRASEARIRAPVGDQRVTAAYLTLHNPTDQAFDLVRVDSDMAEAIELHTIVQDGDMTRMRRLTQLQVPAGGTLTLAPGGTHLMIFGLTQPLRDFHATLTAADGRTLLVSFDIIPPGGQ